MLRQSQPSKGFEPLEGFPWDETNHNISFACQPFQVFKTWKGYFMVWAQTKEMGLYSDGLTLNVCGDTNVGVSINIVKVSKVFQGQDKAHGTISIAVPMHRDGQKTKLHLALAKKPWLGHWQRIRVGNPQLSLSSTCGRSPNMIEQRV